jgi:hypothetical protein
VISLKTDSESSSPDESQRVSQRQSHVRQFVNAVWSEGANRQTNAREVLELQQINWKVGMQGLMRTEEGRKEREGFRGEMSLRVCQPVLFCIDTT